MRGPARFLPAILLFVAACASTPIPSSAPTEPQVPTPPPSTTPIPTAPPSPAATPSPAGTTSPTGAPEPSMTADERSLIGVLRVDAAVRCEARRTDLPEGALHGIECRPDDPIVARVGVYWFATPNEAAHAYMTRMASYGVGVNFGDCEAGVRGDRAWMPGDRQGNIGDPGVFVWKGSVLAPGRLGCFADENGNANVRTTCGNAYVGILGNGSDLLALVNWTWRYPAGSEPGTLDAPGICVASS